MPGVSRKDDALTTGHATCDATSTLDTPGQTTVKANGILIARIGDDTVSHDQPSGSSCVPHTASITTGSGTVRIGGAYVARIGDSVDSGSLTGGSSTVNVG